MNFKRIMVASIPSKQYPNKPFGGRIYNSVNLLKISSEYSDLFDLRKYQN